MKYSSKRLKKLTKKSLGKSLQVAPFWQGLGAQSSMSIEQSTPINLSLGTKNALLKFIREYLFQPRSFKNTSTSSQSNRQG